MATPSAGRPHSGSTPKNTSMATPTPVMPSPRPPTSAAMVRNLSHKSPAMKTPASGHGHSHNISTSSHPSSTPLAAPAFAEETLNFNSPAAIMMSSLGSHGLTPLPTGSDGLGISTDLHSVSAGQGSTMGTRNAEEDKSRRLQEVIRLLRPRVAGRGICREGVERLAQVAGFTHLWQDDTLAIAGTCVDLEITFDNGEKEKVNDAVLKIYTAEAEEHKKAASDVLKANLAQLPHNDAQTPWRGLEGFAHNLEHLGKMDRLSQGINCFEAIDGLYVTFRKIWDEEKKRMDQRRALDRLCEGSVGRPALNKKRRLGLGIEYWAEGRKSRHIESQGEGLDGTQADSARPEDDLDESFASVWTASIDCEAGYPSLRVSREWIADSVFEETDGKNGGSANKHTTPKIAWLEPPPTLASVPDQTNDSTAVDIDEAGIRIPKPPEVRFVANFGPPVLVPLTIASSVLNRQCLSVVLEDSKFTTFDQALRNLAMESSSFDGPGSVTSIRRWNRSVKTFEKGGEALSHHHSHTLHSSPQIWCYPVQSVIFDHPKHLAELLPTLRQYVMLWTLLRSLTTGSEADSRTTAVTAPTNTSDYASSKGNVIKKSNIDPRRVKLNALLQNGASDRSSSGAGTLSDPPGGNPTMPLPIDVTLSLTSTTPSKPKLDLLWPLTTSSRKSSSTSEAAFASVSIEIEPQGEVVVHSATGLPFGESQKGLNSMAKVIGLSEDLGLFVEWVMEKLQDKLR